MLAVHRQQPLRPADESRAIAQKEKQREKGEEKVGGEKQHVLGDPFDLRDDKRR